MSFNRDRDRERDRERDKERAYRDYRQLNSRDDRRDRDANDHRDHESGHEQERSAPFLSSTRTLFDSTLTLSTPSSVTSESDTPPCKKVADVMRNILQLQNKRTPIQDRKSALERHVKEKEDMYLKTKSKHIEYPSLSDTQENNLRRSRQELKQLEEELGTIDQELSHTCNCFAASLLKSLPEMRKNDNTSALSNLESRCDKMEKELEETLKAHESTGENQFQLKLEDEFTAYKAELEKQAEQRLQEVCEALRLELRDELKLGLEAHRAMLDAQAEKKLEESRQALRAELRDEFKQRLEMHQAELDAHAEEKLEESRQALRVEFAKSLDDHRIQLANQFEERLGQMHKRRQAEVDTQPQQRPGAGEELQVRVAEIFDQLARLGKKIKEVEDDQEDFSSVRGSLESFKAKLKEYSEQANAMENTLHNLQDGFSLARGSFESRLNAFEKSSTERSEQIKTMQNILRGCGNGVELMITNIINRIGVALDKANDRITALERIPAQRSGVVQEVGSRISGEANRQIQEGFFVHHQKLITDMDKKYSNFVRDVNDRHEQLEKTFEEKHISLVKTIEENYSNLSNICWGLEDQYQNVNSKDLFQRIIAEASNMLPNSVGNLSTEVNILNVRLARIEQQLVNEDRPDQRLRKRQRTTDE
ncbi:uncharacterized protein PpBr36_06299 [Pyricularia pennisetigena]|uniref:uncharacterized protein n=1 Tax=Pyricularia pennisetigena TaxID=1578925 RepID=UPI00115178CD|nr:uncharacterized protein PpBr36_06299 [Pyricularia pennisetigena]TLS23713.1 hypothetical protein PpBr36_06299 [Pyricularia pennisetigena]